MADDVELLYRQVSRYSNMKCLIHLVDYFVSILMFVTAPIWELRMIYALLPPILFIFPSAKRQFATCLLICICQSVIKGEKAKKFRNN